MLYHNALTGLETSAAILIKEFLEKRSLRKVGYTEDIGNLSIFEAEVYLHLTYVFNDLEEKEMKKDK